MNGSMWKGNSEHNFVVADASRKVVWFGTMVVKLSSAHVEWSGK